MGVKEDVEIKITELRIRLESTRWNTVKLTYEDLCLLLKVIEANKFLADICPGFMEFWGLLEEKESTTLHQDMLLYVITQTWKHATY